MDVRECARDSRSLRDCAAPPASHMSSLALSYRPMAATQRQGRRASFADAHMQASPTRSGSFPYTKKRTDGLFSDGLWVCNCEPRLPAKQLRCSNGGPNHGHYCTSPLTQELNLADKIPQSMHVKSLGMAATSSFGPTRPSSGRARRCSTTRGWSLRRRARRRSRTTPLHSW